MKHTTLLAALLYALCVVPVFALDPHVEAVIRTVEAAKGKVEKTEDGQPPSRISPTFHWNPSS